MFHQTSCFVIIACSHPSFSLPTWISHPSLSCLLATYTLPPLQVLYSSVNTSAISYLHGHSQADRFMHFLVIVLFFSTLIWTCLHHFFWCCYIPMRMLCLNYLWKGKILLNTHGVHTFITQKYFSFSWWVAWQPNDLIRCGDLLVPK